VNSFNFVEESLMLLSPSPKPIDPQLRELVEQIEQQSPTGVSVLAARQFRYSVYQTPVEVTISAPANSTFLRNLSSAQAVNLTRPQQRMTWQIY
jgi:hypothetical protein